MLRSSHAGSGRPVLVLAYLFPPENVVGAARPFRFFRYLPEFGFRPRVITASAQPCALLDIEHVANRAEQAARWSLIGMVNQVTRRFITYYDPFLLWARDAAQVASVLHAQEPFQAIISTSPPVVTHMAAMLIQRRLHIPWIADFRDPLLNNPFNTTSMPVHRWLDKRIEAAIFRHADAVISVTDVVADGWRLRYQCHAPKVRVIWNGYDPADQVKPLPIPPRDYRLLAHIGTFYGGRIPFCVLESLRRLVVAEHVDPRRLRVKFVGCFDQGAWAVSRPLFEEINRVFRIEYQNVHVPRAEAIREMGEADYLLLADNNTANIGYTVPAKVFEYVQMGRPILAITTTDSPVDRILQQSGIPYASVQPDLDVSEFDRRVLAFLQLPNSPVQPSSWFRETFDGRKQTGKLAGILNSTLQGARCGMTEGGLGRAEKTNFERHRSRTAPNEHQSYP